ncbi:MAG TPA: methyl-accepting chemotaxis protein [Methanospirillum sp.]|uniref:methyl-accepting chemotaxis protein n=1 Tax=Methanospirillum sp. TaxID=45200 RepID=UPI002B9A5780|nr:methyl-accepting chemotaxis protein [Methanospirillum sp.]HWQ63222.1 methyl-accepting chemotaxis protein [Methanospirillum sp.]
MNRQKWSDFRSIKQKILLFGGVALLLVAVGIITYAAFSLNGAAVKSATEGLNSIAEQEAGKVDTILEEPYNTASGVAALLSGLHSENAKFPRTDVVPMIKGVLDSRPLYNGVYTIWEPGLFDGRDTEYSLKDGYDKTGRLRVYWYRDANGTLVRKIYDAQAHDPTDYYDIPKKTLKGAITEPYIETMQGSPVLMTSIAAPILSGGKFSGIVGIDVTLSELDTLADKMNIYGGKGKVLIVSNQGMVAGVTGDLDAAGKPVNEVAPLLHLDPAMITGALSKGVITSFDSGGYIGTFVPVKVGNAETPWGVIAFAPRDVVTAEATSQTVALIVIGILISLLGFGLLYLVARSIAQPIEEITVVALQVAGGDLGTEVSIRQRDEVGRLADAFRIMISTLLEKADAARNIAGGNLSFRVPKIGERDHLGESMIQMKTELIAMTDVMSRLAEEAAAGNLMYRGDADRFSGEYRKIISGVNQTLDHVIGPVHEGIRLANEFSQNNFSARFNPDIKVSGDFVQFKESLDAIGVQVSATIQVIINKMTDLAGGAEEAQASIDEVANGASEVATNAEAVSHHADQGSNGVDQVLKEMEDLSVTVSGISSRTEQASRLADEGNTLSAQGQKLALVAEEGMEGIRDATADLNTMIMAIREQMEQINKVVGIITAISDETNLLALNAAIEAARAGEAGRGFSVVADEVKELATESHESAEKIEQMIRGLQNESARADHLMARANDQVKTGYEAVSSTLGIFNKIVEKLVHIAQNTSEVAASSQEQAASVEEITSSVHEVSKMIRQTAENAVSSAAISEESSAAVDQIRQVLEEVNAVITDLQCEIGKFRI